MSKRRLSYFILLIFGVIIFLFCYNVEWMGDDIYYQYAIPEKLSDLLSNDNQRISSVSDIIKSQNNHYLICNGRYVAHFFVQLYCAILGKTAFSITNGLMYLLLIALFLKLSDYNISNLKAELLTIALVTVSFSTKMVPTTQIGFIWSFVLVLTFIYLFFHKTESRGYITNVFFFILSFIAGATQEAVVVGVCGGLGIYILQNFRKIRTAQWLMVIGFVVGTTFLCLAPSNLTRASGTHISFFISLVNFIVFSRSFWILMIILPVSMYSYGLSIYEIFKRNSFYWAGLLVCITFNFLIGIYGNRQLFGGELFSIILILRILPFKALKWSWISIFYIPLFVLWYYQAKSIITLKQQVANIEQEYPRSPSGEVFIEIDQHSQSFREYSYIQSIPTFEGVSFPEHFLQRDMARKFPNHPLIIVLPDYLSGKDSTDIGNKIIKYNSNTYLVIRSKTAPANFKIHRSIGVGPLKIHYDDINVNFNKPVKTTHLWEAVLVTDQMMLVGINSISMTQ